MDATARAVARSEIRELFSDYCFKMDDADYAGVASLFTEDGDWVANYERASGRAAIIELLDRINPVKGVGPFRKHVVANSSITVDGTTATATARSSYLVLMGIDGRPAPIIVGTYADELTCVGGGQWLIRRRTLLHDIAGDLALRLPSNP